MDPSAAHLLDDLRRRWGSAGLDLVHAFSVHEDDARLDDHFQLTCFRRPNCLGLIVGNTKALWPCFLTALAQQPALASEREPLDRYVEASVSMALGKHPIRHEVYYAHHTVPRAFPIQRLAERAGLASLSPSHLSIHARYGPWFALRAVVVLDAPAPRAPANGSLRRPCEGCAQPCMTALGHALELSPAPGAADIASQAAAWIAVRDACPIAPHARYSEAQVQYHYTKARAWLDSSDA